MMKVLSIIHHTEFSGPTNRNMRIAPIVQKKGVDFRVLLPDRPLGSAYERLKSAGVNIATTRFHRLRVSRSFKEQAIIFTNFFFDIQRIRRVIREKGIDIVQLNGLMNPHGAVAARLEGRKVIWQLIDTRSPWLLLILLTPLVVLLSDAVMATGVKTATAHPLSRLLRKKLFYFHPPVDLAAFTFDPATRLDARMAIGLKPDDVIIGTVGTINPQKGHRCFIDAAKDVLNQNPHVKFVIIGSELDTQRHYASDVRTYARKQGLSIGRNLIFIEPGNRVSFFEQALDIFWMTSVPRSEGIPTAIEEAMALGIPVISTDVGAVSEIVRHGETGYIVTPHDARQIALHTRFLLAHPAVMQRFGRQAKNVAHPAFSAINCADRHLACFQFCLQQ